MSQAPKITGPQPISRHREQRVVYIVDGLIGTSDNQRDLEGGLGFLRRRARPALSVVVEFISAHQHMRVGTDGLKWGVESMCAVLCEYGVTIAPSTY